MFDQETIGYFTSTNAPLVSFSSPSTCQSSAVVLPGSYSVFSGPGIVLFRTYCWSELVLPWAAKMPGRADDMRWNLRFQLDFRPMVNSQLFGHEHHWTSHFLEKNTASNSIFHHFPVFVGKNQISSHVCWFQPQAAAARLLSRMDAQVGCSRGWVFPT